MKQFVICGIALALIAGCEPQPSKKSGDVSGTGTITVFGQLVSGSAVRLIQEGITRPDPITRTDPITRPDETASRGRIARTTAEPPGTASDLGRPLADHSLRCVTLEDPLRSGKGTADENGQFALEIDAAGIPFGCFVVDPNAQRVADLLFVGGRVLPSGQHEVSGVGVFNQDQDIGPVWVDASTKLALAASPAETTGAPSTDTEMWDPSGRWEAVECLDPAENKGCSTKELFFYTGFYYENPVLYLNRLAGRDVSSGERRFLVDIWANEESFANCGRTEGISREKAREVYGLDLAPETNTAPFTFRDEPPGANSWDPSGSCTGLIDKERKTLGRCVEVTEPGLQAFCYYDCWDSRTMEPKFNLCVQQRKPNFEQMLSYLGALNEGTNPTVSPEQFFALTGVPINSVLSIQPEGGLVPEMVYQTPNTWSVVFTFIEKDIPISISGQLRHCDTVLLFQYSATLLREGEALGTNALSWNISQTSKDFDFCIKNADLIPTYGAPLDFGESVRYRERLKRAP